MDNQREIGTISEEGVFQNENEIQLIGIIDISELQNLCRTYYKNAKIGYLNINHLRNKIIGLRPIVQDISFTFLAIAETKLDDSFPSAQFQIDQYLSPHEFRKDRNGEGGGILIYIRKGIPCKRLKKYEPLGIESIIVELRIGSAK